MTEIVSSIETVSGVFVDIGNPDPKTILLDDICYALSRHPRFNCHTLGRVWTVGQHSILVGELLRQLQAGVPTLRASAEDWFSTDHLALTGYQNLPLHGYLHDTPEAYLADLPTPVKHQPTIKQAYNDIEDKMLKAIYSSLIYTKSKIIPLPTTLEQSFIKWADLFALRLEAMVFMPSGGQNWTVKTPKVTNYYNENSLVLNQFWLKPWKSEKRIAKTFKNLIICNM